MSESQKNIFRKETLDRISSPDQLTDYLRVTSPGIWATLAVVILLLAGLLAWSAIGTLETKVRAKIVVHDKTAQVILVEGSELREGMPLRIESEKYVISSCREDEYGRMTGIAEVALPDGTYDGTVVTQTVHPIGFLLESR